MPDLRLRVTGGSYGDVDLITRFDGQTTIGQLADKIEEINDRPGDRRRTIKRIGRGDRDFGRDEKIASCDLRSGDAVSLTVDSGVRSDESPPARAYVSISAGPDLGRLFQLQRGESTIGRAETCDVTLNDEMVSRRHAVFRISDIVEVADAGSTNGVTVNGQAISGVKRLRTGDEVGIGDTTLVVESVQADNEMVVLSENEVEFNRPPRIERPFAPLTFEMPTPVAPLRNNRFPIITAIAPLFMGAALYFMTRNVFTIMFIALSPLMIMANFFESRSQRRREYTEEVAEFEATLHDQTYALDEARKQEIQSRHRFGPSNEELIDCANRLAPRLWERELEHEDFLRLRVGLTEQPSDIDVAVPRGGKRDQRRELLDLAEQFRDLPAVPLTFDARQKCPVGIAGHPEASTAVARSLIAQAATLHSPQELGIGALVSKEHTDDWDWLKWLPHCRETVAPGLQQPLAAGAEDGIEWTIAHQTLLSERLAEEGTWVGRHLLLLIDGSIAIERTRLASLLERGPEAGVSVIWLTNDARRVPNACRTQITIEPGAATLTLADADSGEEISAVPIEGMDRPQAETLARTLAPIVDLWAPRTDGADLPSTVSLIDLVGGPDVVEDEDILELRWRSSREHRPLHAHVGMHEAGTLAIDIRVDGPHGLVGGTTGAGKSEFLQSFLAGLALNHSPLRVNFLLVDYKGGSAFGELVDQFDSDGQREWEGLRHTVGMITDLTPALVERALISLRAEVHRREIILNDHRAKDLIELERTDPESAPPNLIIVVDEFAALAKEVPAFVDGVVDIAQRGRSLGLHLLLATQKPGGVITPNIQANTNLRVALRMATEDESQDVVRSPIAGRIDRSTPGRGVIRRGPTDLAAFQSAYVGGTTTPATSAMLEVGELRLGGVRWLSLGTPGATDIHAETDLQRIVRAVNRTADNTSIGAPRRPWLDPLPDLVNLLDLPRPEDDSRIPLGLADLPERQTREVAWFDTEESGSMLVTGMGGAGKTVLLRSLAASFGLPANGRPARVYGLDFAGRGLELLRPLPHVGDILLPDQHESIARLLTELKTEVDRREELFAGERVSTLTDFRQATGADLPRIVVLIDGFETFHAAYERRDGGRWLDEVVRLVGAGRQAGVHFVMTGGRRLAFPLALLSNVRERIVLRMASEEDYSSMGANAAHFDDSSPMGRARRNGTELQGAIVGNDPSTSAESRAIEEVAAALTARGVAEVPAIKVLPDLVTDLDLAVPNPTAWFLNEDFESIEADLSSNVLIAGQPKSGKSTALRRLIQASSLSSDETPLVYVAVPDPQLPDARPLEQLGDDLAGGIAGTVFIDGGEKVSSTLFGATLQDALETGRLRLVVAADIAAARGFDSFLVALRTRCDACVLQPSADTDSTVLGAPIARLQRRWPPGRGLWRFDRDIHVGHVIV